MTLTRRIFQEKRRLIYPLLAVLALNVALFVIVLYPLSAKVATGEVSAQAATRELVNARRDYEAAKATVSGKASADAELKKFYGAVLPPDQSAARRITYLKIQQIAKESDVTYERASADISQERGSTLGKLTTTVVLVGQYREIRRFIYNLETAPEFLVLENVALSQGGDDSNALNLTVKVATYFQAGGDGL